MAIQNINLGTAPNGVGGDTLRSTAVKINENFSNSEHAASKLVGEGASRVPTGAVVHKASRLYTTLDRAGAGNQDLDIDLQPVGDVWTRVTGIPAANMWTVEHIRAHHSTTSYSTQLAYSYMDNKFAMRSTRGSVTSWTDWAMFYSDKNTTKDSNGFLKAASPIVKVFSDKVELNGEAEDQNVTYKKNGIGDYTITTVSGLSTDGWYIELPKDLNGNPKVAVTLSEVEGVITLKSYKRIFSMETFTFEPDLDTPLDIPTDRWIDIRLNEIPVDYTELNKEPKEPYSEV